MAVRHDRAERPESTGDPAASPAGAVGVVFGHAARIAEREQARFVLWWPVCFALGIAAYFETDFEPDWRAAALAAVASLACVLAVRRRGAASIAAALAVFALAAGFAAASMRGHSVAAPVIAERTYPVLVEGMVVEVTRRASARMAVRIAPDRIGGMDGDLLPANIRLTMPLSHAGDVAAGDRVRLRAILMPPPGPATPGGFDFAREAWFDRLGAVGFSLSPAERLGRADVPLLSHLALAVERVRAGITERIVKAVPGAQGAIAAALLTGKRGAIPEHVLARLRDAGLAHLLAISGLHMALVCGTVFGAVSLALAVIPWIALRITVHKWAAGAALAAGLGYFLLAGGSVATERAFIMAVISLGAIILDRPAITFRNVAIAATITLLLRPESLNQAGFQMSFGAVIALVAFYEQVRAFRAGHTEEHRPRKSPAMAFALVMAGVAATTIVATMATGPIAAYHFNRVAMYGLLANLVAVPLAGFVVMPLGIAALALMPLGLETIALELMAIAIGAIVEVAGRVSALEGAVRLVPDMPRACLTLFALGGLWIALWRRPWRLIGIAPIAAAGWIAAHAGTPDLLIAREGRNIALKNAQGELSIALARIEAYSAGQWLRRDGDPRTPSQATPGHFSCDEMACVARAPNGLEVAYVLRRDALDEECWRADIVITPLRVRERCRARLVIDLADLRKKGPHAVMFADDGIIAGVSDAQTVRGDRPWTRKGR